MNKSKIAAAIVALAAIATIGGTGITHTVSARNDDEAKKVFVCKYVSTPGVNERLQTGDNPITVSVNAIPLDPVKIGSSFADQHGRSYVLAFDVGQDEPEVDQCPAPNEPGKVTPVYSYTRPTCEGPGTLDVSGGEGYTWHDNGNTYTAVADEGFVIVGDPVTIGPFELDQLPNPSDQCPPPPPVEIPVPAQPQPSDPCGPDNATWNERGDTDVVTWDLRDGHLVASTRNGYVFEGGATSHDFGVAPDSGEECPIAPVPGAEVICTSTGPDYVAWQLTNTGEVAIVSPVALVPDESTVIESLSTVEGSVNVDVVFADETTGTFTGSGKGCNFTPPATVPTTPPTDPTTPPTDPTTPPTDPTQPSGPAPTDPAVVLPATGASSGGGSGGSSAASPTLAPPLGQMPATGTATTPIAVFAGSLLLAGGLALLAARRFATS